jgi:hypothetical protein
MDWWFEDVPVTYQLKHISPHLVVLTFIDKHWLIKQLPLDIDVISTLQHLTYYVGSYQHNMVKTHFKRWIKFTDDNNNTDYYFLMFLYNNLIDYDKDLNAFPSFIQQEVLNKWAKIVNKIPHTAVNHLNTVKLVNIRQEFCDIVEALKDGEVNNYYINFDSYIDLVKTKDARRKYDDYDMDI